MLREFCLSCPSRRPIVREDRADGQDLTVLPIRRRAPRRHRLSILVIVPRRESLWDTPRRTWSLSQRGGAFRPPAG